MIVATDILGIAIPELAAGAALVVLVPTVLWFLLRTRKQWFGGRAVYQEFAQSVGATWSPPRNQVDTVSPGRVKGRYREHKISIDSTIPTGAMRGQMPETVIRVSFSQSLRLGINGGSGTFRARKPGSLQLADARLSKLLRVKAKDEAGAQALLSDPGMAEGLMVLHRHSGGVGIDDGTLSCALPLPTSAEELRANVDRVIEAIAPFDRAQMS